MKSYDPDRLPEITPELLEASKELGQQILHVVCDDPGAQVGDNTGVSFLTLSPFLPRPGDRIRLEDEKTCEVSRVYFKVRTVPTDPSERNHVIMLVPNVFAILIE